VDDRERDERLEVEEQDEPDVSLLRCGGELVAAPLVLEHEVGREPERVHAGAREAPVHRLEEVLPAAAELGVGVGTGTVHGAAVGEVAERRLEDADRVRHPQHGPHGVVVEEQRHRRPYYGLTIEP
jgi:hypothetical protein